MLRALIYTTNLKKEKMKNIKTTLFGAIGAIAGYFATSTTGTLQIIGQTISALSTLLLGYHAADKKN